MRGACTERSVQETDLHGVDRDAERPDNAGPCTTPDSDVPFDHDNFGSAATEGNPSPRHVLSFLGCLGGLDFRLGIAESLLDLLHAALNE